jgi:hypothetical protein
MGLFEQGINVVTCGMLGMWGRNPKHVHSRSETHKLRTLRGLVLHHFGTRGKKGNMLIVEMAKSFCQNFSSAFVGLCWDMKENVVY